MSESRQPGGRLRPLLAGALLRTQTDARLTALAAAGNEPAFAALFERYHAELCAHASRIVRHDRAEDVVQQVMLNAWTALLAGAEVENLRAWLHRIVHNASLSTTVRRGYDDIAIPETRAAPNLTEDLAEGRLSAAQAMAAIAALPEAQRRALTLTAIDGRSGRDSALAMGISESALRQLTYRARAGVRQAVSALIPLPLITWLAGGGAAGAAPAAIGLGAAAGTAATTAKVIAVIGAAGVAGVAGATLGATHAPKRHPHHLAAPPLPAVTTAVRKIPPDVTRAVFAAPSAKVAERQEQVGQVIGNQDRTGQHGHQSIQGNNGAANTNGANDTSSSTNGADNTSSSTNGANDSSSSPNGDSGRQSGDVGAGQRQQDQSGQTQQQQATSANGPNQP